LITTLIEMCIAGDYGMEVFFSPLEKRPSVLSSPKKKNAYKAQMRGLSALDFLFHESLGLVLEVTKGNMLAVTSAFKEANVPCKVIGKSTVSKNIKVSFQKAVVLDTDVGAMRALWESTSYQLEMLQANPVCVDSEAAVMAKRTRPNWTLNFTPTPTLPAILKNPVSKKPKVAVLRQEGSNGDREMCSAFYAAGFDAWDVCVSDLMENRVSLDQFRGVAFVGGFSFADVLDSAKGWAAVIQFNSGISAQFQKFKARSDTFSLGVCNGCQLMALLGWVPAVTIEGEEMKQESQPRFIRNSSGRFESRFVNVQVQGTASKAVMLKGMEGSSMGVWVQHGEGRCHFADDRVKKYVMDNDLAPIRYVDDENNVTEEYPYCPNGSTNGIAALCSEDGRHLAMMPHPERVFATWQYPWMPAKWSGTGDEKGLAASPWLKLFQNAYAFATEGASE